MLIDRKKATNAFKNLISSQDDWIYVIGKFGIGKSYFIKNIINREKIIYCEPDHSFEYWKEILKKIPFDISNILLELLKHNILKLKNNYKFNDLSDEEKYNIVEEAVIKEIHSQTTIISKFLGEYLSKRYDYIVLDNLFKCDTQTYNWMVNLLDIFTKTKNCYVIAICDIDKYWISNELESDLFNRFSRIEIDKYDDSQAYYDLINSVMPFDNSEMLDKISKDLYKNFNGSAHTILKLISLIKKDGVNTKSDKEKREFIIDKAIHLSSITVQNMGYIEKEILAVLAISPIPLPIKAFNSILECDLSSISNGINNCLDNDLVVRVINKITNATEYELTNSFSNETYIKQFREIEIKFFYEKIYRTHKLKIINLTNEQLLEIAIKIESEDVNSIAVKCFKDLTLENHNISYKAELLNAYLSWKCSQIPKCMCTMKTVNILYMYGHYQTAYKVICKLKSNNFEYDYLMKKGDIEHLLLHPNTAKTFEKASKLPGITVSQMLSAINRQIMALTQENKSGLEQARTLYMEIMSKYSNEECNGLIELYRNSNNIFSYSEALEFTIKGYNLAVKLNNNIEKLKTLHNICMLKVLNGNYYSKLSNKNLNIEPDFNMICNGFENHAEFLHELSYPLLDLGTLEMFSFIEDIEKNTKNLYAAKKYFSRAQIYAKSFYAKNIANISLLIVNSYLHKEDEEYIIAARKRIFDNYSSNAKNIKDFRVHRKILFALATSASITNHIEEGVRYLRLSKPHVFEDETLRYNNLCDDLKIPNEKIDYTPIDPSKIREYHKNSKFVPWLISFGH